MIMSHSLKLALISFFIEGCSQYIKVTTSNVIMWLAPQEPHTAVKKADKHVFMLFLDLFVLLKKENKDQVIENSFLQQFSSVGLCVGRAGQTVAPSAPTDKRPMLSRCCLVETFFTLPCCWALNALCCLSLMKVFSFSYSLTVYSQTLTPVSSAH